MNEKTPPQAAPIATILENTALFPGTFQPPVHHAPGWVPMPQYLRIGFMKHSLARGHSRGAKEPRISIMSVSSISSVPPSPPVKPPEPVEAKAPEVKPDSDTDSAPAYQPPAQSPLPPGQGTRIDQLV
jgi:hypothetical protein